MVLTWGDADFGLTRVHDPADDVRVAETAAARAWQLGLHRRTTAPRGFFTSAAWWRPMGGPCGRGNPAGSYVPVCQPARFRPPAWQLGCGDL